MKNYKFIFFGLILGLLSQVFVSCEEDDENPEPSLAITSIDPDTARVGESITLSGKGFSATPSQNEVVFTGSNTSTPVTAATSTSLVVLVPDGAESGPITVTVGGKSVTSTHNFILDTSEPPLDAPGITAIDPTHGLINASVIITGENFSNVENTITPTVFFDDVEAEITDFSATEIEARVPSGLPEGEVSVTVNREGQVSNAVTFVVDPLPVAVRACYWSSNGSVSRGIIDEDGVQIEVLYDDNDGVQDPTGIVIDKANNLIYWADNFQGGGIFKAPMDGSGPVTLVFDNVDDISGVVNDIALDPEHNTLYITAYAGDYENYILKGNLNNPAGGLEEIYMTTDELAIGHGMKLLVANNTLYWTEFFSTQVKALDLEGSSEAQVLFDMNDGLNLPYGLAVNPDNNKIYIIDNPSELGLTATDAIYEGNLDGSGTLNEIISAGDDLVRAWDLEIDIENGFLFWINKDGNAEIKRAKLDGSSVETLFGGIEYGNYGPFFDLDIR